jgi:hypothetical protein
MPADSTNKRSARKTTRADRASPDSACGMVDLKAEKQPRQLTAFVTAAFSGYCEEGLGGLLSSYVVCFYK